AGPGAGPFEASERQVAAQVTETVIRINISAGPGGADCHDLAVRLHDQMVDGRGVPGLKDGATVDAERRIERAVGVVPRQGEPVAPGGDDGFWDILYNDVRVDV